MTICLSRKHRAQLLQWAEEAGKQECCGLLLGRADTVSALELAKNVAVNATRHFEIDPAVLITKHKQAREGGLAVLGCFHSHPNGLARPSITDDRQAAADGQIWLIIANGEITAWKARGSGGQATEFVSVTLVVEG